MARNSGGRGYRITASGLGFFGVLGLVDPAALAPGGDAEAAEIFASYMSTRNLVLCVAAVLFLALRAWRALSLVLGLNAVVQALDAVLGAVRGDILETVSPAVIAVVLLAAVAALLSSDTVPSVPPGSPVPATPSPGRP